MDVESTLNELSELLCGLNYEVFLLLYKVPHVPGAGVEHYVSAALGPTALVDGSCSLSGPDVLATVEVSLRYSGNYGHGPFPSVLSSEKFEFLLERVLSHVEQITASATLIEKFWLKDSHSIGSVFWGFAFVIAGPDGAEVFIGSSSD